MADTANSQVLEQSWLGGEQFVSYLSTKDKFDTIDKTATSVFKLALDQLATLQRSFFRVFCLAPF